MIVSETHLREMQLVLRTDTFPMWLALDSYSLQTTLNQQNYSYTVKLYRSRTMFPFHRNETQTVVSQ